LLSQKQGKADEALFAADNKNDRVKYQDLYGDITTRDHHGVVEVANSDFSLADCAAVGKRRVCRSCEDTGRQQKAENAAEVYAIENCDGGCLEAGCWCIGAKGPCPRSRPS
jgi:hypothetical protein